MRIRQDRRKLTITVLAGVVAALALLNWHLMQTPIATSPIGPEVRAASGTAPRNSDLATALDKKPVAQFRETVSRPLFNPSRRPVQRESAPKATQAAPSGMRLVGVMKSTSQPARALIRLANETTGKWVAEGEEFNGWKLREVNARSIVVESGGRAHELTLQSTRRTPDEPEGLDSTPKSR